MLAEVESIDHEGRGVAHVDGKAIFIDGALPTERVRYASFRKKSNFELAHLLEIVKTSPFRTEPRCQHYGICGGCALQHLDVQVQVAVKQRILEDNLWHIARLRAAQILPPISGKVWEYRHRARLSVRHVAKKGGVLVGFHEKKSNYVTDMNECAIVPRQVSELLPKLRLLFAQLAIRDQLPQMELAVGDATIALVLRVLQPVGEADGVLLKSFIDNENKRALSVDEKKLVFYLQPKGPDSVVRYYPAAPIVTNIPPNTVNTANTGTTVTNIATNSVTTIEKSTGTTNVTNTVGSAPATTPAWASDLYYEFPEYAIVRGNQRIPLRFYFTPTDFTQVNFAVNRILVRRAMNLLAVEPGEVIGDLFCGLGNFSLPMLVLGASVIGVEGNASLVKRAGDLAQHYGFSGKFVVSNLFQCTAEFLLALGRMDKMLIDPPREGAVELAKSLVELSAEQRPRRIVYVSCNPSTLARDASVLVHQAGYRLTSAGIANMFAHTTHVESIAQFDFNGA